MNTTPVFIFIGDSITELGSDVDKRGFVSILGQDYRRKADIINRGCGGWTTKTWLPKLELIVSEWKTKPPVLLTIFLGANDAALKPGRDQHQHVPLDEYASRSNVEAGKFADACLAVGAQVDVPVIDLWRATQDQPHLLSDGLHLTQEGNVAVHAAIAAAIRGMGLGAPLIVTLGDSITQNGANPDIMGYQVMLTQDYVRKADVVNRGCSGWTTRDWMPKLPLLTREWSHKPPALVTIFLGANDAALKPGPDQQQHVPLDEYVANLKQLVHTLPTAFPGCKILLLTPPPVDDARYPSRSNVEAGKYAAACVGVGAACNVPVVDFWTAMQGMPHLFVDGLHFNKAGNVAAHAMILGAIRKHFPDLAPEALPVEFER
ncbi:isoamyl acetate-hydrolyzing esterase [Achlya hypogyna]|uniref:Isoamyl acetate-hydrolyzing esterase n=1 Tax=Achlya hypogyna TaxID=1202772 RepID=A0A1V9Y4T8_ACHHY|nr:isoamyl acetate-hydrolyzing esterase [Achlya hypogyna]